MKKNILLAVFCLILSAISFAQVPQKMSYQAVVRGSDNNLVTNHQVAMRVSILHGSADGTAVYTETHSATTNANGLLTIEIGDGTSNDDFTAINWANGPFFVKTETDVNGGDDYDIIGVSQLLSVPYAMYAQTAGNMPDVSGFLTVETQTIADVAALGNSVNAQLKNVTDPTDAQDATTKKYVDDLIAALQETLSAVICNITFDANGGTGTMNPQTMVKGAAQAITTNTFTKENCTFAGWNTAADGSGTSYTDGQSITISGNMTLYAQWRELRGILNGYEWVDLGLPSGLRWATCNVGAASLEEYGNYYAWGETSTKTTYTQDNYTYSGNPTTLPSSADAATVNWGSGWRMPTDTEMNELNSNCTVTWTTQNGVNGCLFTGPNGNSIFLPAAGYRYRSSLDHASYYGYYWSSSLYSSDTDYAWYLFFGSDNYRMNGKYRDNGRSVRPVCVSAQN